MSKYGVFPGQYFPPMTECDFNKVAKQLYWNRTSAWEGNMDQEKLRIWTFFTQWCGRNGYPLSFEISKSVFQETALCFDSTISLKATSVCYNWTVGIKKGKLVMIWFWKEISIWCFYMYFHIGISYLFVSYIHSLLCPDILEKMHLITLHYAINFRICLKFIFLKFN